MPGSDRPPVLSRFRKPGRSIHIAMVLCWNPLGTSKLPLNSGYGGQSAIPHRIEEPWMNLKMQRSSLQEPSCLGRNSDQYHTVNSGLPR